MEVKYNLSILYISNLYFITLLDHKTLTYKIIYMYINVEYNF